MKQTAQHWIIASVIVLVATTVGRAEPATFFVSVDGHDDWTGRVAEPNSAKTDGPFATLARARDALRTERRANRLLDGASIVVQQGTYFLDEPLKLTADDSGTRDGPVVYQAADGQHVRLIGGRVVREWSHVKDAQTLQRMDPAARRHVVKADLKKLQISDFGSPAGGGIELFVDGQPMTVSRWPNDRFVKIVDVLGKTQVDVRGTKGRSEGIFTYDGDRPARWVDEQDAWVHGYWFWDWSEQRHKIKSIDRDAHVIEVQPPYHGYGYRKGQWFYAFNLLSEIDQPGEWYLDRPNGALYWWPPSPDHESPDHASRNDESEVVVSVIPTILDMQDVSYVSWRGFTFEAARGTAITMSGGTENRIVRCTIRNVGDAAVTVSSGTRHGVVGCDMYQMGGGGISLSGGDRATLTPAEHFAENNHIHHFGRIKRVYQPGITLGGVGNRASHNLIHHAPHMGMGFSGNDHLIEFNEIHRVCYESNDAGAIYAGRNWTMRGTIIRNNYLHHITGFQGRGCVGVYLDDMFSGTEISFNVFYRVTRAAFIGGGRDCIVKNNLFVACDPSLHIDARALGWAKSHAEEWIKEANERRTLSGIQYKSPPYSERYPALPNILNDNPAAPVGNRVSHNVSFRGKWDGVYDNARKFQTIESNFVDRDPMFATPERIAEGKQPRATDFALRPDSPVWDIGFEKLPLDRIGIFQDKDRASWPVRHQVR